MEIEPQNNNGVMHAELPYASLEPLGQTTALKPQNGRGFMHAELPYVRVNGDGDAFFYRRTIDAKFSQLMGDVEVRFSPSAGLETMLRAKQEILATLGTLVFEGEPEYVWIDISSGERRIGEYSIQAQGGAITRFGLPSGRYVTYQQINDNSVCLNTRIEGRPVNVVLHGEKMSHPAWDFQ
ncbi:hypothetical protein HYX10_00135 [Candidatus Woesearchaeota archaeon]|nr:hypothetical protein [Candidatus Woesearchaeota archaeon]